MPPYLFVFLFGLNQNAQPLVFTKIVYHSSRCYGTCPEIDLQIDSSRNILLHRQFWKSKGETEDHRSGNFIGSIDTRTYSNLIAILISSNYTKLKFPPEFCCDAPLTTIIIYTNNERTYLKSMFPPAEAQKLISWLYDLGVTLRPPAYSGQINFEQ
jgi:hypothetical protein